MDAAVNERRLRSVFGKVLDHLRLDSPSFAECFKEFSFLSRKFSVERLKKSAEGINLFYFSAADAIDIGNNKKALQEVEKVLKKTPNLKTAIALKALSLIRLGREKESQALIEELEKGEPDDDATLQVMTYCYRELDQRE